MLIHGYGLGKKEAIILLMVIVIGIITMPVWLPFFFLYLVVKKLMKG